MIIPFGETRLKINLKPILTTDWFITFLYRINRIYSGTFRLQIENEKEWLDFLNNGGTVVLCAWHQQFFSAIRHFQNYQSFNPSIMISRSDDGSIVSGVAERTGWNTVRGSSSRGGKEALKKMIVSLKKSKLAGHIVDGPRGPSGIVKSGVIRLAQAADAVIVPFYVSAASGWHFRSWDKFLLPKPFSNVSIHFGKMIKLERTKDKREIERQRRQLEEVMLPALKG